MRFGRKVCYLPYWQHTYRWRILQNLKITLYVQVTILQGLGIRERPKSSTYQFIHYSMYTIHQYVTSIILYRYIAYQCTPHVLMFSDGPPHSRSTQMMFISFILLQNLYYYPNLGVYIVTDDCVRRIRICFPLEYQYVLQSPSPYHSLSLTYTYDLVVQVSLL